jgi:hypothetical protein
MTLRDVRDLRDAGLRDADVFDLVQGVAYAMHGVGVVSPGDVTRTDD